MRFLAVTGFVLAAGVTARSHAKPVSEKWAEPVGPTRLRYSDLPITGSVLLVVSYVLVKHHHFRLGRMVGALAVGASAGALFTGLFDPLPER